ncbi:MAG: zinc-binding dehydrogenase, partial [Granulosicoccus sp.]
FKGVELSGFWLSSLLNRKSDEERQDLYAEVIEFMQAGNCNAVIDSCYRMIDISDALKRAESQERNGKVMILPNGEIPGVTIAS